MKYQISSTKFQINPNHQNSKPPHPIPLPRGERDGVRGGHEKLEFGAYLGFGILGPLYALCERYS
jgi:hypothetical protein